jgi:hypothetical protein
MQFRGSNPARAKPCASVASISTGPNARCVPPALDKFATPYTAVRLAAGAGLSVNLLPFSRHWGRRLDDWCNPAQTATGSREKGTGNHQRKPVSLRIGPSTSDPIPT